MKIRLTKKLADALNGLDLTTMRVGAVIDLDAPMARMLIAENWAEEAPPVDVRATADDQNRRTTRKRAKSRVRT